MLFREQHATVLRAADFDAMVGWYRDTLGLELIKRIDAIPIAVFSLPGPSHLCIYSGTEDHDYTTPAEPKCMINWRSDDLEGTREALIEAGVPCDPIVGGDGFRIFRFRDPEGTPHDCCEYDERWLPDKA